ncbi:unnamed protein product (macronuclear) [Paramecium tetraurelia]|uniref:Uncharacterized protein n=1 Tax=Paramecium tetraurelia TaxID=5888 RepID=A0D990_PARTE|nr:uncharacterized protein GSPATT00014537001 [Paramecium tetraurelia]CAK79607.1 unnamed protein product [Paramecium tetraurelia]|eukprot:XP_001447004.1 hypothetical protein (macronuclear) [Paramecium tetraurelia strain d4-2]
MLRQSESQEQVNICLRELDQWIEVKQTPIQQISYTKIDDAIASFEDLLHPLEPTQSKQQLLPDRAPQTNPFKVQLKLEDIIIHQMNDIQKIKNQIHNRSKQTRKTTQSNIPTTNNQCFFIILLDLLMYFTLLLNYC